VECLHCKKNITPKKRKLSNRIAPTPFLICPVCGRAQPKVGQFKPGRGTGAEAEAIHRKFKLGASQIKFRVLVWGPQAGKNTTSKEAKKRVDIKDAISENGHRADFSEHLVFDKDFNVPVNVQERAQDQDADLRVCLATDFGALLEVQEFASGRPAFTLVWMKERAKGTYSDKGLVQSLELAGCPVVFFNDADLDSCILATASAHWVERWRYEKWAIEIKRKELDRIDPMRASRS